MKNYIVINILFYKNEKEYYFYYTSSSCKPVMRPLNESQIVFIESFVRENDEGEPPNLLIRDIENTKAKYVIIRDTGAPYDYYIAGTNPNGFTMYNLYRSSDNTIYLFTTYVDRLSAYYKVNEDWINTL